MPGRRVKDLTGKRFGWLTVVSRAADHTWPLNGSHEAKWNCVCKCGSRSEVAASHLVLGRVKSCGCYGREQSAERMRSYNERRKTP